MRLIDQYIKQATKSEDTYPAGCNGHPVPVTYFDKELFAKLIINDVITTLAADAKAYAAEADEIVRNRFLR